MADLKDLSHIMGRIHGAKLTLSGWAITFDWSALEIWNKHFWTAFWKLFSGLPHLPDLGMFEVPAPGTLIFRCHVLCVRWHERWASGVSLKRVIKMRFRNSYFRLLVLPSQKLWPKPDKGNFVPCILPCKIGGSQNLMSDKGAIIVQNTFSNICL